MAGGYHEKYRENVLRNALAVYDSKLKDNAEGSVPLKQTPRLQESREEEGEEKEEEQLGDQGGAHCSHHCPVNTERRTGKEAP